MFVSDFGQISNISQVAIANVKNIFSAGWMLKTVIIFYIAPSI